MRLNNKDFLMAFGQYAIFLLLCLPCLAVAVFLVPFLMKLGELFAATDSVLPSFLDFLLTLGYYFFSNFFFILIISIGLAIGYEKFYKKKNKNTLRGSVLALTFLIFVFYCLSVTTIYIALVVRSLSHPKLSETIDMMIDEKNSDHSSSETGKTKVTVEIIEALVPSNRININDEPLDPNIEKAQLMDTIERSGEFDLDSSEIEKFDKE